MPLRAFDRKSWLDTHVVPLLHQEPPASIYTVFWNGAPPTEVLVFLLADTQVPASAPDTPPADPWPRLVKRLLESGFRFDYLREIQLVQLEGKQVPLFGGDGAPLFDKSGAASARLFKKLEDGTNLILHIGHIYPTGLDAAVAVKSFFGLWDANPVDVCAQFSAPFGQA